MPDFNFLLENRLSQDQQRALRTIEQLCRAMHLNLYLTGGPMRDLLIGRPLRMLEITVEGDPARLDPQLRAEGGEHVSFEAARKVVRLRLHGIRLRIGAARSASGQAGSGTIVEELRARGLTVNSIGLSLNPGSRGLPIDPTNGAADIEAGLIRMNHPYAFFDEPMLMVRALRLHARLGFEIEERTLARMASAREAGVLDGATASSRGQELEAIAYEPDPALVLQALDHDGWLESAFGRGVRSSKMNLGVLSRLGQVAEAWELLGLTVDVGLIAVVLMLGPLSPADQARLASWLPSRHLAEWKKTASAARAFEKHLMASTGNDRSLDRMQDLIEKSPAEAVVLTAIEPQDAKAGRRLKDFQTAAQQLRQRLPLGVLRSLGMAPHSQTAEELLRPFYRRLLGGESIEDAALAEQIRAAAVLQNQPAALSTPAATAVAAPGKRGRAQPAGKKGKPAAASTPRSRPVKAAAATQARRKNEAEHRKPATAPAKKRSRPSRGKP